MGPDSRRSLLVSLPLVLLAGILVLGAGVALGRLDRWSTAAGRAVGSADDVSVSGLGRVSGVPDVLGASLGVQVRAGDVSSALAAANTVQAKVTAALRRDGVAADDLQTSDVSIYPTYDSHGHPSGYSVSESVTAKLRVLRSAGRALSDAVAAGGDAARLDGVSFSLADNAPLLARARAAAYADARVKAQDYARLAGRRLGRVELVSEVVSPPQPAYFGGLSPGPASAGPAIPISPGVSQVSVSVTVRWALTG